MKNIKRFGKFTGINENQSKKIRKYVDFSTFLDWFNKNRPVIADILDCDVEDIVDEETLLKQSSGLINIVINTQSEGWRGRDGVVQLSGFKEFDKLKSKIIHDILHNIYDVTDKDFSRTNDYDYDESEYIEEIEVLALEEVYSKYFNMEYVNSDFLNQNINRLTAFLAMVIIRNDPDRIVQILDGEVEPYIEVYGKKYPIEGTPFQNLYEMFKMIPINPIESDYRKIEDGEDFKEWIVNMCAIGDAIDSEGGNRADFPGYYFLGDRDIEDIDDDDFETFLDGEGLHYYDDGEDWLDGFDDETVRGYVISEYELPKDMDDVLGSSNYENMEYEDLPKSITDGGWFEEDDVKEIFQITDNDNIEHYGFFDRDECDIIVHTEEGWNDKQKYYIFKKEEIDADEDLNDDESSDETVVEYEHVNTLHGLYDDYESDYIKDYSAIMEYWWEFYDDDIKSKTPDEYVNYSYYQRQSLDSNISSLFSEENSHAIARRYLRHNDTLVNNRAIGSKKHYQDDPDLDWDENRKREKEYYDKLGYKPIDEESFDSSEYISLGKSLTTDNAKKLKKVLDTFRGWTVKNFDELKTRHKKLKSVLSQEDIEAITKMPEFFKQEIRYNKPEKNRDGEFPDDYKMYTTLTRDKDAYIFKFDDIIYNESVLEDLIKYAEYFNIYKELFNKFSDEDVLNYIKKIPSITEVDSIKNNIDRFHDMFKNNEVDVILKNKDFIERLIKLSKIDFRDLFKKELGLEGYVSYWKDFNFKTEKSIVDTTQKVIKDEYGEDIIVNPDFETEKSNEETKRIVKVEGEQWVDYGMRKLKFKIKK
jgi:hypothetical protein